LNTRTSTYQSQINFFVKPLQNQENPSKKCANAYTFGFNGQEKDDETYGGGNAYDFGARIYDPRLGRFMSIDPKWKDYSSMSPYCFAANTPILCVDENGEGPIIGFIIGAAVDYGFQVAVNMANGHSFKQALTHKISISSILISGVAGAATSGISAFATGAKGLALLSKVPKGVVKIGTISAVIVTDGTAGIANKAVDNYKNDKPIMEGAVNEGLVNAATGQLGDGVAKIAGDICDTKQLQKLADMYIDRNVRVGSNSTREAAQNATSDLNFAKNQNEIFGTTASESTQSTGNLFQKVDGGSNRSLRDRLKPIETSRDNTEVDIKR
jgi:RHS repeat-associated protein